MARTQPMLAVLPRSQFAHSLAMRRAALAQRLEGVEIDVAGIAAALRLGCTAAGPSGRAGC